MFYEYECYIGGISVNNQYASVQLSTGFVQETIDVSQYYDALNPVTIVGATSGVRAKVVGFKVLTTAIPLVICAICFFWFRFRNFNF